MKIKLLFIQRGLIMSIYVTSGLFFSNAVLAQGMNNAPWSPQPSNRASIAALMRQVENGNSQNVGFGYSSGSVTQLVCGASNGEGVGSSSNAQANSSCIILNNSDAALNINQESDGDQTSDAYQETITTVEETINNTPSSAVGDALTSLTE